MRSILIILLSISLLACSTNSNRDVYSNRGEKLWWQASTAVVDSTSVVPVQSAHSTNVQTKTPPAKVYEDSGSYYY